MMKKMHIDYLYLCKGASYLQMHHHHTFTVSVKQIIQSYKAENSKL